MPPSPAPASFPASSTGTVSISAETYARLLSLADQAPLECLPLTSRTLACARTMGYNQIGQIRSTPSSRLFADLGEDRAEELQRALYDFGMRPQPVADPGG
jgi:DNA-directed RNA polymerase alpha subunit